MKRFGNLLDEVISHRNIQNSFFYVLRGKRAKTRRGRYLIKNTDKVIEEVADIIKNGKFRLNHIRQFEICERGKRRTIQSIPLVERIILNATMAVVEKYVHKTFITDTASSIKGRGMHYLHKRFTTAMKADPDGTQYAYKCDIHHFYQSIDQDKMWMVTMKYIKDKAILHILHECIYCLPKGLSIGLRASQCLANLYLSHYVDHELKERSRCKHFYRYCDDILIFASSKHKLTCYIKDLRDCINNAGLELKQNEQFFSTDTLPIDFLGYVTYRDGNIRIRKRTKTRFAKRWKRVRSASRRVKLVGAFYGIAKHAKTKNLFKTITGIDMRSFAELGMNYVDPNGNTYFDVPLHSVTDVMNCKIVIEDAMVDVVTKNGKRTIIKYSYDGEHGKFFTSSEEMKFYCQTAIDNCLFPFETTIVRKNIGHNKYKYVFT